MKRHREETVPEEKLSSKKTCTTTKKVRFHSTTKSYDGLSPRSNAFFVLLQELIKSERISKQSLRLCIRQGFVGDVQVQINSLANRISTSTDPKRAAVAFPAGGCDYKFFSDALPALYYLQACLSKENEHIQMMAKSADESSKKTRFSKWCIPPLCFQMQCAIRDVQEKKMSYAEASEKWNIPDRTLRRYVRNQKEEENN